MKEAIGVRFPKKILKNYIRGEITFSEAAKQAGLTLWGMEKYMTEQGLVSNYLIEDLEKELED